MRLAFMFKILNFFILEIIHSSVFANIYIDPYFSENQNSSNSTFSSINQFLISPSADTLFFIGKNLNQTDEIYISNLSLDFRL